MGRNSTTEQTFERLHPRAASGRFSTKETAEADGGLDALAEAIEAGDAPGQPPAEDPHGAVLTDAELVTIARMRARSAFGRGLARHGETDMTWYIGSSDDLASEVLVACIEARRRGIQVTPAYVSVVTRRMASPLRNLAGRDRAALGQLATWRRDFANQHGRQPSDREVEAQAEAIRTTWPNPKDRPSQTFHRVTSMQTWVSSPDLQEYDRAEPFDAADAVISPVDHTREDRLEDAIGQVAELEGPQLVAARRTAWLTFAQATGAPTPTARLPKNKVTAIGKVLAAHAEGVAGGVRQGVRDYGAGHDSVYAQALVAPWSGSTVDERDAVVDVLATHPQHAGDLWASALSCTSNRHRVAA